MPDVVSDDRYYASSVGRAQRTSIETATTDYFFPPRARDLLRQLCRWARGNQEVDRTVGAYERNEHEHHRRPYFGADPPPVIDRCVYLAVAATARVLALTRRPFAGVW